MLRMNCGSAELGAMDTRSSIPRLADPVGHLREGARAAVYEEVVRKAEKEEKERKAKGLPPLPSPVPLSQRMPPSQELQALTASPSLEDLAGLEVNTEGSSSAAAASSPLSPMVSLAQQFMAMAAAHDGEMRVAREERDAARAASAFAAEANEAAQEKIRELEQSCKDAMRMRDQSRDTVKQNQEELHAIRASLGLGVADEILPCLKNCMAQLAAGNLTSQAELDKWKGIAQGLTECRDALTKECETLRGQLAACVRDRDQRLVDLGIYDDANRDLKKRLVAAEVQVQRIDDSWRQRLLRLAEEAPV